MNSHQTGWTVPDNINTLIDAQKIHKSKARDAIKSLQTAFTVFAIASLGEIFWESVIQNDLFDDHFTTWMASTICALEENFTTEFLQRTVVRLENEVPDMIFSTGLYKNFEDSRIKDQTFLKMVNPDFDHVFVRHVSCVLTRINNFQDVQKKCLMIFTKSSWLPDELEMMINPEIPITNAERLLIDHFLDGECVKMIIIRYNTFVKIPALCGN